MRFRGGKLQKIYLFPKSVHFQLINHVTRNARSIF